MSPIKKIRLVDSVIEAINDLIVTGEFKPGDRFYSESELTRQLEVSRSSIREAIRILEATGHVYVRHGKGIFITDRQQLRVKTFSEWLRSSEQKIHEDFEVRLIIEPKTAAHAAQKADAEDIAKLETANDKFAVYAEAQSIEDAIVYDGRFHRLIAGATKNTTLHALMKSMTKDLPAGWVSSLYAPGRLEKAVGEHAAILDAIKRRDPAKAENAMSLHLASALNGVTEHLRSSA